MTNQPSEWSLLKKCINVALYLSVLRQESVSPCLFNFAFGKSY